MLRFILIAIMLPCMSGLLYAVEELPVKIGPDHEHIHLTGRFNDTFQCAWTGSGFVIKVKASAVNVLLEDHANGKKDKRAGYRSNYFNVIIDGGEPQLLHPVKGQLRFQLLKGAADKEHTIQLFRRTEALFGLVSFKGLELSAGGTLLAPPIPEKKLMVLGDSITCGYGNEAESKDQNFIPLEENGYMTYAPIAARALDAEYHCVAWSGQGLYRNRNNETEHQMPALLLTTIPQSRKPDWDLKQFIPDYFVVNLGTNDTAKGIPDEEPYVQAAQDLVDTVLGFAPDCRIYFCVGPMIGGKKREAIRAYYSQVAAGNDQVYVFDMPNAKYPAEAGAHWHPKVVAHERCGKALAEFIKANQ